MKIDIQNVTKKEEALLRQGICPDCGTQGFFEGPSGGSSINIICSNKECQAKFNMCGPFTPQRLSFGLKVNKQ